MHRPVIAAAVVAVVLSGAWLARAAFIGETLLAGDGWRIEATWAPFGPGLAIEQPDGTVSLGGLPRSGDLSEALLHHAPDGVRYVVGVVPAGASGVRVVPAGGAPVVASLHRLVLDRFFVAPVGTGHGAFRLEAFDEEGDVVARLDLA